jgi:large subunit ribosomal protein L6
MSRIGKQAIDVPENITVNIEDRTIKIKGEKGELSYDFGYEVEAVFEKNQLVVNKIGKVKNASAIWGTTRAILQNMVTGVTKGYEKKLELHGVGYKMAVQGKKLVLNLGFSHPIEKEIEDGLKVEIEKNELTVSGIDKQRVGQLTAEIRAYKKVEPYKGKGFRYVDEQFIKKEGKKAVAAE